MNRPLLFLLALLLLSLSAAQAQFGNFSDVPIEINAEETRFEGGIAVAEGNVVIRYGTLAIYADYAQYNPDTRDVLVLGNVRVLREGQVFTGDRAIYNLETKQLTAAEFRTGTYPYFVAAETIYSLGPNAYRGEEVTFTTSDNSKPDYFLKARGVRIYPDNRVILRSVTLHVGKLPIFYFPYVYQSLKADQSFSLSPGYSSRLGAFVLFRQMFPIGDTMAGTLRIDPMSERGVGVGLNIDYEHPTKKDNWARFRSYYLNDSDPGENLTSLKRDDNLDPNRYRITLQSRQYFTDDIYATVDITKLSDVYFFEDFEPGEFRRNPNPDNFVALTKWDEDYTLNLIGRLSLNDYLDFTERLPELALDIKRQPIFEATGLFYEGETSTGYYRRNFSDEIILEDADEINAEFEDYATFRADTFHQLTWPQMFFDWLSVVPRVGLRGTFYNRTGQLRDGLTTKLFNREYERDGDPESAEAEQFYVRDIEEGGSTFRGVVNLGLEVSFKLSKAYEQVQSRFWGLDGLRHVLQPFANYSFVWSSQDAEDILQFDRVNPYTKPLPIDFPQFTSTDSITSWNILRLGVRNRLQTRRDDYTFNWFEWQSFFDIRFQRPEFENTFLRQAEFEKIGKYNGFDLTGDSAYRLKSSMNGVPADGGTFSNWYNNFRWNPVPWAALNLETQLPVLDDGFSEVNTSVNFLPTNFLQLQVSHRYLDGNAYFRDSNQISVGAHIRLGENWGFTVRETYEFKEAALLSQRYEIQRDLSSWIAAFGLLVRDNGQDSDEFGVILSFTLKDLPQLRRSFDFDPSEIGSGGGGDE